MDYLPISKVNTVVYCPRRFWLEFVAGEVHSNVHTIEGHYLHAQAYTEPNEQSGLWVWSDSLGLVGIVDRLEYRPNQTLLGEYKRGKAKPQAHDSDAVQLAAYALALLESRQIKADGGFVYYHASRTRRQIELDAALLSQAQEAVKQMRALLYSRRPPPVTVPASKCLGCSVQEACQPKLLRN